MSDDYKQILNAEAKTNPCVGISAGEGILSMRLEFRLKSGERISFAYAAMSKVHLNKDQLTIQFSDDEVSIKGIALAKIMDELSFHRVLWLAEGDNEMIAQDGEPYIQRITLQEDNSRVID